MGRHSKIGKNNNQGGNSVGGASEASARADLLNFHFSTSPPTTQNSNQNNNNRRHNNNNNNHYHQHGNNRQQGNNNNKKKKNNNNNQRKDQNYKKNQQNWSSARRRSAASMFYLHSSADHAFIITRKGFHLQEYSFSGCDEPVSWESVRIVKQLIPAAPSLVAAAGAQKKKELHQHEQNYYNCPICLDSFVSSRITKCGHTFCLPCILRHVQSQSENNPYAHVKCPCCGIPLHVQDLRPVMEQSCIAAPKERQSIRLTKLHRTKECPTPYLPVANTPRRASPHAAPCITDCDASYSRFNYIDYELYHQHLQENQNALEQRLQSLKKPAPTTTNTNKSTNTNNNNNASTKSTNTNAGASTTNVYVRQQQLRQQQQQQQQRRQQQQRQQQQQQSGAQNHDRTKNNNSKTVMYFDEVEAFFINLSLETVRKELQKATEEAEEEKSLIERFNSATSGIYQTHPKCLFASNYHVLENNNNNNEDKTRERNNSFSTAEQQEMIFSMDDDEVARNSIMNAGSSNRPDSFRGEKEGGGDIWDMVGEGEAEAEAEAGAVQQQHRFRVDSIGSETAGTVTNAVTAPPTSPNSSNIHEIQPPQQQTPLSPSSSSAAENNNKKEPNEQQQRHRSSSFVELPSSMYLDDGSYHFYQSTDGQLCFLSGFNMSCLLSDYASSIPDTELLLSSELSEWERRKMMTPLPDYIEGLIFEIESIHLTQEVRKRMPFLSHLPLHIDVTFVELDINRYLTYETKQKFRAEFDKRRKRRSSKFHAEKRADSIAKKKERERINELKAQMQRIDPNDDFFHTTTPPFPEEETPLSGESFGPAVSEVLSGGTTTTAAAATTTNPTQSSTDPAKIISFSKVCKSGGSYGSAVTRADVNFPALGSSPQQQSFPALVGPSSPRSSTTTPTTGKGAWGSSKSATNDNHNLASSWGSNKSSGSRPSNSATTTANMLSSPSNSPKKKGKGKKIVLFSTGGHRGTSY